MTGGPEPVSPDGPGTRRRIFPGWNIAGAGLLISFYVDGVGFWGFSGFFREIIREFQWERAIAAVAPSLQQLQSGILAPFTGLLVDRWGPRRTMLMGYFMAGSGFMLLSRIHNLWQYYLVFVVIAFGLSSGSFVVIAAAINNWFVRKRARALSILILGPGLSGVLGGTWILIIPALGWRTTLLFAGFGFWAICIPLAFFVIKDRPEPWGLRPDGDVSLDEVQAAARRPAAPLLPIRTILRSRGYWQYVTALAFNSASFSTVIFAADALTTYGFSNTVTGSIFIFGFALPSLPARLAAGWLADTFDKRYVFGGALTLQMIGTLVMAFAVAPWMAFVAAALVGMGIGSNSPSRLSLQAEYWGSSVFGRLAGIQMGVSALPAILSPLFVGFMFDTFGTYRLPFALISLPLVVSVTLALTIPRPAHVGHPRSTS